MQSDGYIWGTPLDYSYGDLLERRAAGALPEMQSSIAAARRVAQFVRANDAIADVGCGAGHYLTSLRRLINTPFRYVGIDGTPDYLARARGAYPGVDFVEGNVFDLPCGDDSFDIVMCNNVLLHLPSIEKPLAELIRVARCVVLIRTLVGETSFLIRECRSDKLDSAGNPTEFNHLNIYSDTRIRAACGNHRVEIKPDDDFDGGSINADAGEYGIEHNITRALAGKQVRDYIIMPWAWITIQI